MMARFLKNACAILSLQEAKTLLLPSESYIPYTTDDWARVLQHIQELQVVSIVTTVSEKQGAHLRISIAERTPERPSSSSLNRAYRISNSNWNVYH